MKKIEEIDKNFNVAAGAEHENIYFRDVNEEENFMIYGVFFDGTMFRRIPSDIAETVSEGVSALSTNTAGGRVRFRTDSRVVVLRAEMGYYGRMPHFAFCGSAGFDMYDESEEKHSYLGSFLPPMEDDEVFERTVEFDSKKVRDIVINMPTYSNVEKLYIGLEKGSCTEKPKPYKHETPVVYYGSSITQGGCAARPGNTYQSVISRRIGCDFVNLGFSGNAKGERQIAEYISKLNMSVFVYDYDYNAPTPEHLLKTHKPMFDIIRTANPDLHVIMVSRPNFCRDGDTERRIEIIRDTYDKAVACGDKNVSFVDGQKIGDSVDPDIMTVDGTHPNDFGFWCMAEVLGEEIEKALLKKKD